MIPWGCRCKTFVSSRSVSLSRSLRAKILRRSRRNAECDEVRPICQNAPIHPSPIYHSRPGLVPLEGAGCENHRCEKMSVCRTETRNEMKDKSLRLTFGDPAMHCHPSPTAENRLYPMEKWAKKDGKERRGRRRKNSRVWIIGKRSRETFRGAQHEW